MIQQGYQRPPRPASSGSNHEPPDLDVSSITFNPVQADLFDSVAEKVAKTLADNGKSNKPTQLRRFYDEICMWAEKIDDEKSFRDALPFIRMLNAKAAYAQGRNQLVDKNFVKLMHHCLAQVNDPETMKTFKIFMEAVMGFYKKLRPKDS